MISFVTVVFNDLKGLRNTINSLEILHQLDVVFEHIIIDGQSTDGTKEFIASLSVPYRLVWVSEPDSGIYDAMNKGLERCNNSYLNFLNAGDIICFDKFDWRHFINNLQQNNNDIVACGYVFKSINSRHKYVSPRRITCDYPGMPSSHQAIFFKSGSTKGFRYDDNLRVCGDFDFVMQMISKGANIMLYDHPVIVFESGGLSFQKPLVLFIESMHVSAKYCVNKLILPLKVIQLSMSLTLLYIKSRI